MDSSHAGLPVLDFVRRDTPVLARGMSVAEALDAIRERPMSQTVIYFYVVDETKKLVGVLPTRSLLLAQPEEKVADLMIARVVAIPQTASVLDACEFFVLHKFLAFPVVDSERHVVGTVDINLFNEEVFGIPETARPDDLFQALGFHISELRNASAWRVFRFRFPWLLVTIGAGTVCAFLARAHETTLSRSLFVAFFLTLVLALNEAVTVQSMALAVEAMHAGTPSRRWYLTALRREILTAVLLGLGCGGLVAMVVAALGATAWTALVIAGSIAISLCAACLLGLSIPTLLHAAKLDVKIAAGPITLALTDVSTLLIYFTLASAAL
ncbi:MAG: magnesium transporter [Chthoniobacter sp.]|jgi:magnesium transporter|nr:magnesium transporter [Chthoniobacter sp.]